MKKLHGSGWTLKSAKASLDCRTATVHSRLMSSYNAGCFPRLQAADRKRGPRVGNVKMQFLIASKLADHFFPHPILTATSHW